MKDENAKDKMLMIADAKRICEEILKSEFAFINKIQLSMVIRNLVVSHHETREQIKKLEGSIVLLERTLYGENGRPAEISEEVTNG